MKISKITNSIICVLHVSRKLQRLPQYKQHKHVPRQPSNTTSNTNSPEVWETFAPGWVVLGTVGALMLLSLVCNYAKEEAHWDIFRLVKGLGGNCRLTMLVVRVKERTSSESGCDQTLQSENTHRRLQNRAWQRPSDPKWSLSVLTRAQNAT